MDCVTTAIFTFEAIIKMVTLGLFWCGKHSYLRNPWNVLDFSIVIFSILSVTPLVNSLQVLKMFRIVRVLRLIGKDEGL